MLFTVIAILCFCCQSVVGTTSVEEYIRKHFATHPRQVASGAAGLRLPAGKQWASGRDQVKIMDIPIPNSQANAYIIPMEMTDNAGTKYEVQILFYVGRDDIDGGEPYAEHARIWTLQVGPKGHTGSFITIKEHYDTHRDGQKYIKPIESEIRWAYHDLDAAIEPFPKDTIAFLGCFWFQLFSEFDLDRVITTDGAHITIVSHLGKKTNAYLMFIRAFAGKPSIYVKEKTFTGGFTVSSFKPNPGVADDPCKSMSYLDLIKKIKTYKMADIKNELDDRDWQTIVKIARITAWDTDGSFTKPAEETGNFMTEKDEIGPFMEFLWFGDKGSVVGKKADVINHWKWLTVFKILQKLDIFKGMFYSLHSRYNHMVMTKPLIGWSMMCLGASFEQSAPETLTREASIASRTASESYEFDIIPREPIGEEMSLSAVHHGGDSGESSFSLALPPGSSSGYKAAHSFMSERYNPEVMPMKGNDRNIQRNAPYIPDHMRDDGVVMMFLLFDGVLFSLLSCLCVLVCLAIYCVFNNKEAIDPCIIIDNLV